MYFDEEKLASIRQYLDEHWPLPRTCPTCRSNPEYWRVSETPVLLTLLTGSSEISMHNFKQAIGSLAAAPAVAVTCSDCGHILLFNAAQMGIAPTESGADTRFSIPSE